jgi:VanZ family protein
LNSGASPVGHSRRRLYFWLLVVWVVFTFSLTSLPRQSFNLPFRMSDKAAHLGFYCVMGFLCALWRRESGFPAVRAILYTVLFASLAGGVDEVHQLWIPGRSMELLDWMADTLGGGIGAIFSVLLPHLLPSLITE